MRNRRFNKIKSVMACLMCMLLWNGCNSNPAGGHVAAPVADRKIVVGFSQVGAESDWRNANTESMKNTFTAASGFELIFSVSYGP